LKTIYFAFVHPHIQGGPKNRTVFEIR